MAKALRVQDGALCGNLETLYLLLRFRLCPIVRDLQWYLVLAPTVK